MISNKKGFELSINFLVMIIISIVIFAFGIRFIYQITSSASELQDLTAEELDERVADLLCRSSDKVCIAQDKKTIPRGEMSIFALKLLNVVDAAETPFQFTVSVPDPEGYNRAGQGVDTNSIDWIFPRQRDITLQKNEEQGVGFAVEVPKNAPSGTFIFNINIIKDVGAGDQYVPVQKLYVEVP